MANYSLVIGSKYSPFTYDELLKPALMATQAHHELENQYSELATKANVWEEMANEQTDPYAYKMYKTYANDLESQAGQLAREGLTPASRQNMLKMKQRYSSEIIPIEQAYKKRQELIDEQRKLQAQDNTMMFDRSASMMSLDDLIKSPQLTYQSYSGATLTKQVSDAVKGLSKKMRDNPIKWRSILGDQYFEIIRQKGYSPEEIIQVIQNDSNASLILQSIVEDAVGSSGISKWGDETTLNRAYEYARHGLWDAVGETQYQTLDNWRAKMDETYRRNAEQALQERLNSLAINPLNIYSNRELSAEENKYKNTVRKFSKYFTTDANGKVRLTEEGMKEYRRNAYPKVTIAGSGSGTARLINAETGAEVKGYEPSEFKKFMDSIGMNPAQGTIDNWNAAAIGNLWQNYLDNDPSAKTSKYDAIRVTEFDYPIAGAQQVDMKTAIINANRGLNLKEVDYDSESKEFKDTGEEITMEELKSDKYQVTNTRFSHYGNTVMIQDDKGNARRFRMPGGINSYNEGFRDLMMEDALEYQELLKNPNLSVAARLAYQNEYKKAIQNAYLYHSQLLVQNETKKQTFNPYGY